MKKIKGSAWSAEDDAKLVEAAKRGISWRRIRGLLSTERSIASVKIRHWLLTSSTAGAQRKRTKDNVSLAYVKGAVPTTAMTAVAAVDTNDVDVVHLIASVGMSDMKIGIKKILINTLAERL